MDKELTVMLPAYNEEENLEKLVCHWNDFRDEIKTKFGCVLKIIAVNDGSSDKTKEIGIKLENEFDNFTLINHEVNKGLGEAVKTGIIYILDNCPNSQYTCTMDCDNTHNPCYVIDMIKKQIETGADVIIASRYQKGADIKGVSSFRLLTSEGAKYVYSILLGVKNVRDYTCGYRLYSNGMLRKAYDRFKIKIIEESGFACMAELLYKLCSCGAVFAEVPFELRYDLKMGESKMNVVKTAKDSVSLAFRLRKIQKKD